MDRKIEQDTSLTTDGQLDDSTANGASEGLDTTQAFHSIFQGQTQFNSWEEFIQPFEEFQTLTNSVFKPKSTVLVDWINEKRTLEKIPKRFVYSQVSMICQNFGLGVRKEGSTRKNGSYIGQNCEAFVKLSYKKGFLNITKYNLVHTNHPLISNAQSQMRKLRPIIFDDDLDLLVCKVSEECNVFESRHSETNWQTAVTRLPQTDPRLEHITRRMLKRRLQFLMDRYAANSEGREPLEDDELGIILHRLLLQKAKITSASESKRKKKQKQSTTSQKKSRNYSNEDDFLAGGGMDDDAEDSINNTFEPDSSSVSSPQKNATNSGIHSDVSAFFNYWTKRDSEKCKLKWEEMKLRKAELELQKSKFELEQKERLTLLELLKTQEQMLNVLRKSTGNIVPPAPPKSVTREFILNKDGSLQPVIAEHEEPNKTVTATSAHTHNVVQQHAGNITVLNSPMPAHSGTMVHAHTANLQVLGHAATMPGHGTLSQHTHGQAVQVNTQGEMSHNGGMGGQ